MREKTHQSLIKTCITSERSFAIHIISQLTWNDNVIPNDRLLTEPFLSCLSVLPRSSLFIPLVCCMTLIAFPSALLPFPLFIANPSLLPIPSTFQKPQLHEPALARTKWRQKPYAIYASLLPVSSQTETALAPSHTPLPTDRKMDKQSEGQIASSPSEQGPTEPHLQLMKMYTLGAHCLNS